MPDFLSTMFTRPVAIAIPDEAVKRAPEQPYYSHEGALAEMSQPQNCPVPPTPTLDDTTARHLQCGMVDARRFFQGVMKPTIKHY